VLNGLTLARFKAFECAPCRFKTSSAYYLEMHREYDCVRVPPCRYHMTHEPE
jgi:hypothetical protein